jgi:hypothetical protein
MNVGNQELKPRKYFNEFSCIPGFLIAKIVTPRTKNENLNVMAQIRKRNKLNSNEP